MPYQTSKIFLIVIFIFCGIFTNAQSIQDRIITGNFKDISLHDFFQIVEKQYDINFFYEKNWIDSFEVNVEFKNTPAVQVFNKVLDNKPLSFQFFQNNSVVIFPKSYTKSKSAQIDEDIINTIGDPLNEGRYNTAIIHGRVLDGKNSEPLVGAVVYNSKIEKGATTNADGFFELELPTGEHTLQLSFIGYEIGYQRIKLIETGDIVFDLFEETHNLEEVVVVGDESKASKAQMSMIRVNAKMIKELPVLMGEADVIKSVVLMPGIQSVGEMASGFNVRGGNTDQNLVMMDGAPVFNTSHLFGFFSMINSDAVKDVVLFKGGIPASYGERVASIMDVQLKDGNQEKLKFYGGVGLINSRITLEGPFVKNKKSTFLLGARSTYSDWLLRQTRNPEFRNSIAHFYDLNGSANFILGSKNQVKLMGYYSSDAFNLNSNSLYNYGNLIGSMNWRFHISEKFISNLNIAYSKYDFHLDEEDTELENENYVLKTGLDYGSIKYQLSFLPNVKHRINLGFQAMGYKIRQGEISPFNELSNVVPKKMEDENSVEFGAYLEDDFDLSDNLSMNIGLRYSGMINFGPSTVLQYDENYTKSENTITDTLFFGSNEVVKSYMGLEPRVSFKYTLNSGSSIRASYQRINQYVNQVSNTSVVSPADFWKSSDYYTKPLISDQIALGFFKNLENTKFETSVEVYYKNLQNLLEYKNGAQIVMNNHLETDIIQANGYSYGIELFAKKNSGRLNGWISYAYSRTLRRTDNEFEQEIINNGKYFPSVYDKPHDLSVVANYQISRRWRLSSNFVISSGRPVTLPEQNFRFSNQKIVYYSDRNKYRMPPYHRLDVSITIDENLRKKRMWKGSWTLSVYNVYGRKNPYSIFYRKATKGFGYDQRYYSLYKLSIIGIPVPSLTYNFKF